MFFMYFTVDMDTYDRVRCTKENFAAAVLFGGSQVEAVKHWERYKLEGRKVRVLTAFGQDVTPLPHQRVKKNKGRNK